MNKITGILISFLILFSFISCENGTTTFTYGNNNEAAVKLETINGKEGAVVYYDSVPEYLFIPSTVMGYDVIRVSLENASKIETLLYALLPETVLVVDSFYKALLLKNITLPSSLLVCPGFEACAALESITIPDKVQVLELYNFAECSALKSITFGKSLHSIHDFCFMNCTSLTEISFENSSVSYLGNGVFSGCSGLTSINFGNSMSSITKDSLQGLTSLTSIKLGRNMKNIGVSVFESNTKITTVYCYSLEPPSLDKSSFYLTKKSSDSTDGYYNMTLYVLSYALDAYKNHEIWGKFKNIQGVLY